MSFGPQAVRKMGQQSFDDEMRAAGQALYAASFRRPRSIRRLALDTKPCAEELESRPFYE